MGKRLIDKNISFIIDVELFTSYVRNKWAQNKKEHVKEVLKDCGLDITQIRKVVYGELKLEGENNKFNLVPDSWKWQEHYEWYGGIKREDDLNVGYWGCGFIDRNGNFYKCNHQEHSYLLKSFNLNEDEAEEKGWVKIGRNYISRGHIKPNKKQINKLVEWCILNRCRYEDLREDEVAGIFNKKPL